MYLYEYIKNRGVCGGISCRVEIRDDRFVL